MFGLSSRPSPVRAAIAALAFTALPGAIVLIAPAGTADADVCGNVGRRVSVGGCVNVADAVAPFAPPPGYYAPLPEDVPPPGSNVNGCINYNGRWVHTSGCR